MAEGKRARPEDTKCPSAALLPEAIFNYVLTVEEYIFALSEEKMPENCERARKNAQNYANDFFFHSCVLIFQFSFMPCRERTYVKEQKHTLPVKIRNALLVLRKNGRIIFAFQTNFESFFSEIVFEENT